MNWYFEQQEINMHFLIRKLFPKKIKDYYRYCQKLFLISKLKHKSVDEYKKILQKMYFKSFRKFIDFNNPKTFTEKIQWTKLYDITEEKIMLSDKLAVRSWVREKIGSQYLIPLITVFNDAKDINLEGLPKEYVIQCNHGSGMTIVVNENSKIKKKDIINKIKRDLKINFGYLKLERQYIPIKPKAYITENLNKNSSTDLLDYKFLCFNGKVKYCWVDTGRYHNHKRTFYDCNWNKMDFVMGPYCSEDLIEKPLGYTKMIEVASILSTGFKHVRVDLYNVNGTIYFGEMTFTSAAGFEKFTPEKYDRELGEYFELNLSNNHL